MKKYLLVVLFITLSSSLLGCTVLDAIDTSLWSSTRSLAKKSAFNKYGDYASPEDGAERAKVIIVGNELTAYDIYDYRDKEDNPVLKAYSSYTSRDDKNAYDFPNKKIDFNLTLPSDFKGDVLYSFYMKPELHSIIFSGHLPGKNCTMSYLFNPEPNKNYVLYFHKAVNDKDKEICVVKSKEIVYKNGTYKYLPEDK